MRKVDFLFFGQQKMKVIIQNGIVLKRRRRSLSRSQQNKGMVMIGTHVKLTGMCPK